MTIDADLYKAQLHKLYMLVSVLEGIPLDEMLTAARRAETAGPFVDPTLFRAKGDALMDDIVVLLAACTFMGTIDQARQRAAKRSEAARVAARPPDPLRRGAFQVAATQLEKFLEPEGVNLLGPATEQTFRVDAKGETVSIPVAYLDELLAIVAASKVRSSDDVAKGGR